MRRQLMVSNQVLDSMNAVCRRKFTNRSGLRSKKKLKSRKYMKNVLGNPKHKPKIALEVRVQMIIGQVKIQLHQSMI